MATLKSFTCGIFCFSGLKIISQMQRGEDVVQQEIVLEDINDKEANDSGSENNTEKSVTDTKNHILAHCCSQSGKYFAVSDDFKQLHLYKYDGKWTVVSRRFVARRCTAMCFTQDDRYVLVADKTGDVYRFAVEDESHTGELLLGHLSMLLDIVTTNNDRFVVTCDRDEKIRVSCYPNSYNVYSYCLQHTEYVASVIYIKDHDLLLSGGGDGKLIIWNLIGETLCVVDCETTGQSLLGSKNLEDSSKPATLRTSSSENNSESSEISEKYSIKKCVYSSSLNTVCVCFYNSSQVFIYKFNFTDDVPKCALCDIVTVSKEPWDICCDSHHNLYVLQSVEGETILVYQLKSDDTTVKAVPRQTTEDDQWMTKLDTINKNWTFFQASEDIPSMYQNLKKIKIDQNMKDYLEKKQIRLSGQKIPQPPSKKVKQ